MKGAIPTSLRGARWAAAFLAQHRDEVVMTFPPRFVQSAMIAVLARGGTPTTSRPADTASTASNARSRPAGSSTGRPATDTRSGPSRSTVSTRLPPFLGRRPVSPD